MVLLRIAILTTAVLGSALGCGPSPILIARTSLTEKPEGKASDCDQRLTLPPELVCLATKWTEPVRSQRRLDLELSVDLAPSLQNQGWELRSAQLWMPSMGHGSSPTRVVPLDRGSWRIESIYFLMPGDWEIRLNWSREGESMQSKWSGVVE